MAIDCIIAAGGAPGPEDPLYEIAGGRPKTLIEIAGKPMVQWVLDAVTAAPSVARILLIGVSPADGISSSKVVDHLPDEGSLVEKSQRSLTRLQELHPEVRQVLACSGDIPLITPEMIEWLVAQCPDPTVDLYHCDIPRATMERTFPQAGRTYLHFAGGDIAGGDVHIVSPHFMDHHQALLEDLVKSRKSALKQALRLGPAFFIRLALRRLTFEELERRVARKFHLRVRVILANYAELGMDVDKPHQLEICRQVLETRPKIHHAP
ncbi:MAG: NTP transferase domain-containing protein [Anaerolineae bacterium]|nr:NTP transferase domain-containing protein [Anaerolineae bacterium]